jgi:hypothetical protein
MRAWPACREMLHMRAHKLLMAKQRKPGSAATSPK